MEDTNSIENSNILSNGRPTIAVLVGSMSSTYQEGIMRGAAIAGEELDYNVIGFSGGPINSPDPLAQSRETLFDLINPNLIDGVIVPISSHTRYLSSSDRDAFIHKFDSVPIINIGSEIDGYTNLMTDYQKGLHDLIHHYVHVHGYKRIAFFRGPDHHASSSKRLQIFQDILAELEVPFYEELVIYGDLRRNSAKTAVTELLDERQQTCDAIISVNDNQAFGIIEALIERGIRVPEDIAVSGSLDNPEGNFSEPQLTTIREPLFELGYQAMLSLASQIKGADIQPNLLVSTELIIRHSCGCSPNTIKKPYDYNYNAIEMSADSVDIEESLYKQTFRHCEHILAEYRCVSGCDAIYDLLPLYRNALVDGAYQPFLDCLQHELDFTLKSSDVLPWLDLTATFLYSTFQYMYTKKHSFDLLKFVEAMTLLKKDIEKRAIIYQSFETDFYINFSREIVNNLNSSFDLNAVRKYAFRLLDLTELYINIYDKQSPRLSNATNIMAVRNKIRIEVPEHLKTFPSNSLLPDCVEVYRDRYTLMVFPLSFRKKPLGFLMVNLSDRKGSAYENMQAIISTALKNELQIQELKEAEARFSDIAHSTSDWLWETNTEHIFTYSSRSVKHVIGYDNDEILHRSITSTAVSAETISYFESMKRHQSIKSIESWHQNKNGNVVCLLISATPIKRDDVFVGYRGVFKDVTEQKLQEEKIKNLAYYDVLTGLPNRTMFQDSLDALIKISMCNNQRFGLMFIDVDRFKYINDSLGHAAGDELLKKLTIQLKKSVRSKDTIARLGGDEFTILLPKIGEDYEVIQIAKRILENTAPSINISDKQLFVTLSIGIAMYPFDGNNATSLLKNADTAMYRAKSKGRNRYIFYDHQLEEKNTSRIKYEAILYNALKNQGIYPQFQPKINAITKAIVGFEALARIDDIESGTIAPDHFIPIAEELGLIGKIDERIFEAVCQQYKDWKSTHTQNLKFAVNISAVQLKNISVVDRYLKIAENAGIDPSIIQLEITENALIDNDAAALQILTAFKKAGFTIALDDFGTGYSSLSSIRLYPFDTVKIDQSFIKDMTINHTNHALITAIVQMAKSLNLEIVAEGVETEEQYLLLKEIGCDHIQGYYFSRPMNAADMTEVIEDDFTYT